MVNGAVPLCVRPQFEAALALARQIKATPRTAIIFTVYEMKRLGRDAAELTAPSDHLTAHGLILKTLAGPLPGMYDPSGPGRLLFAFFAAMAETERENIRESTVEGLDAAARKGKRGGRPPVITDDTLHTVLRRRENGESVEQIQPGLIIPTDKRKGQAPSVASIYRALAEHEKKEAYPAPAESASGARTTRSPPRKPLSGSVCRTKSFSPRRLSSQQDQPSAPTAVPLFPGAVQPDGPVRRPGSRPPRGHHHRRAERTPPCLADRPAVADRVQSIADSHKTASQSACRR
ncbi:recombinase family protein [Streptomyces sp. NPDC020362]|uniref:recombinase family protein n=1 Tax=unclassified Streptomyces TaxID=2593676 RepID=UPI0033FF6D23